jgi:Na+-translocating ferredoxin:NAD+ oxidoreductase RnfA subunit
MILKLAVLGLCEYLGPKRKLFSVEVLLVSFEVVIGYRSHHGNLVTQKINSLSNIFLRAIGFFVE